MKSYDQTERRFDRKASFSVKLQETESVNNFVKTETNVKTKGSIQFFDEMSETVMGYEREWQGKKMVVLCNFNRNKMHKYALRNILKILLERRTYVLYNKYIN